MESFFSEYKNTIQAFTAIGVIASLLLSFISLYFSVKKPKHKLVAKMDFNISKSSQGVANYHKLEGKKYNFTNKNNNILIEIESKNSQNVTVLLNRHTFSFLFCTKVHISDIVPRESSKEIINAFESKKCLVCNLELYLKKLEKKKIFKPFLRFMKLYIFTSTGQKIKVKLSEKLRTKIKEHLEGSICGK